MRGEAFGGKQRGFRGDGFGGGEGVVQDFEGAFEERDGVAGLGPVAAARDGPERAASFALSVMQ